MDRDQQHLDANLKRLADRIDLPRRSPVHTPRARRALRLLRVAGPAAAAMIAIVAFVAIVPGFHRVQADTILSAFRATLLDGFRLEFSEIGTSDWRVSGELVMLADARGRDDQTAVDVFLDADLLTRARDDFPALNLRTTLALTPDRQWAFLNLAGAGPERFPDDPLLAGVAGVLNQGVVLQLNGVWEAVQAELIDGRLQRLFASRSHDGSTPELESLGRALLLGKATPAQLERLIGIFERAARDVTIERLGGDLYALRVARLDPPAGMVSADDAALLAALEIEIAYRTGSGIAWAEIRHVGRTDGLLRLEPTTRAACANRFDLGRIAPPGSTVVLDIPSFVPRLMTYLS